MSIAILPEAVSVPPSIQSTVSRLAAGFHHMRALGAELTTLDAVSQDIRHTHAMIRRDIATSVLQTAHSVKTCQDVVPAPGDLKSSIEAVSDAGVPDQWTKRLLRWADQLGRDLFGIPGRDPRTVRENPAPLPPQKRQSEKF